MFLKFVSPEGTEKWFETRSVEVSRCKLGSEAPNEEDYDSVRFGLSDGVDHLLSCGLGWRACILNSAGVPLDSYNHYLLHQPQPVASEL